MLDLWSEKSAEMTAEQLAGGAPPGGAPPGAMPPGGAPQGAMPPGADPAAMAAAGGDPLAGMPQQPVTLEDAAKQGDPLAGAILQMLEMQKLIAEQIATLLDNSGAQVPASSAMAAQMKQIQDATKTAAAESLGQVANPGETGGLVIETGLATSPSTSKGNKLASHWRPRA